MKKTKLVAQKTILNVVLKMNGCTVFYRFLLSFLFVLPFIGKGQNDSLITNNFTPESVEDYLFLSNSYINRSSEKTLLFSNKALALAKENPVDSLLAKAYKSVGIASYYSGDYKMAILYFDSALVYFKQTEDNQEIANIYNNFGICYSELSDYLKAVEFYRDALDMNIELNNLSSVGHLNNNLGSLYYELMAYNQAMDYFQKAYKQASLEQDKPFMLTTLNNIGLIQQSLLDYEKALSTFSQCIQLANELNDDLGLANCQLNKGNIYIEKKLPDSAFANFLPALKTYEDADVSTALAWLGIGRTHQLNENHRQALTAFERALEDIEIFTNPALKIDILKELYYTWEKLGNVSNAYQVLKEYHIVFDTVKSLFDSEAVANLQAKFDVDNKLKEISILKEEKEEHEKLIIEQQIKNSVNRVMLLITLGVAILLFTGILIYYRASMRYKKISAELSLQNRLHEEAREALANSNQALAAQEELLRTLINATPDLICFKDDKGRWLESNDANLALFGLNDVDFKLKTNIELAALNPKQEKSLRDCVITDEICWQKNMITRGDEEIVNMEGEVKVFDVIKVPLYHEDGSRKGLIVLGRDLTKRKNAENKLNAALHKAEESERFKAAFLSNMSHEIRTPLNAVVGFSDLLDDDTLSKETRRNYIKYIHESGDALLSLIGDIIDLSLIEAGELALYPEPVQLNDLFQSLHDQFLNLAILKDKSKLNIYCTMPTDIEIYLIDKQRIKQIMLNLFDNALKYTDKGSIEIGFSVMKYEDKTPEIRLFVKDSGVGIPEEKQHLLFSRFTKLHDNKKKLYAGTGLGLSIVKQLVLLMGGNIEVLSIENSGTEVTITLPAHIAILPKKHVEKKQERYSFAGKKFLVVEDVDSNYDLLRVILESSGAYVQRACNGIEAVEMSRDNPDFDLILMDIQLPEMNGYLATAEIKKFRPEVPIIAQTAFAMANEKEACIEAGCDGYIAKPIKAHLLLPVLFEMLRKSEDSINT